MMNQVQRSIDIVLYINDIAVAGQENVRISRNVDSIDITNNLNGEWKESIGGLKSWSVNSGGCYVKNSKSLTMLENAFLNNEEITVKIIMGKKHYQGQALIIDFPLNAVYNNQFKYTISLLGTGELRLIEDAED